MCRSSSSSADTASPRRRTRPDAALNRSGRISSDGSAASTRRSGDSSFAVGDRLHRLGRPGSSRGCLSGVAGRRWLRPWWYSGWQWLGKPHPHRDMAAPSDRQPRGTLPHAWTLCYEEQFYAVMGLILVVASSAPVHRHGPWVTMGDARWGASWRRVWASTIDGFFFDGFWVPLCGRASLVYAKLNYASKKIAPLCDASLAP